MIPSAGTMYTLQCTVGSVWSVAGKIVARHSLASRNLEYFAKNRGAHARGILAGGRTEDI